MSFMAIKRNILLNPGPSTTTDTVKMAQVVPDICPREEEFGNIMKEMRSDLVRIVHGDPQEYTAVLFCGSGTINIDVCLNSLLPEGKKILVVNNGAYSARAVEICEAYGLDVIDLQFSPEMLPDLELVEKTLQENSEIALVHTTHNETGTGILNPIREMGALAHKYNAVFTVDTTSTYAMRPIHVHEDNIDFCMASAQKGLMSMTGLSFFTILARGSFSMMITNGIPKNLQNIQKDRTIVICFCSMTFLKRPGRCTLRRRYRRFMRRDRRSKNILQRAKKINGNAIRGCLKQFIKGWNSLVFRM